MNNLSAFESIKHIDDDGREYWLARELSKTLEYNDWRNFRKVLDKAKEACINSSKNINEHIVEVNNMLIVGNNAKRQVEDYKLSRYACYLIVQNGDSRKEVIALGQTYFAIQTRRQELFEREYSELSEDEKRLYQRKLTKKGNLSLNRAARDAGVKHFDKFHNYGYRGLYNGETADDIAKRKNLRYREDVLDNMGSDELIINLFRISQTEQKLKNDNINGEFNANMTHYNMGKDIRKFIEEQGGTLPEDMPTPNKSLKKIDNYKELDDTY